VSGFPNNQEGRPVAHIVIMGAGIGGMPMAYDMRKRARKEDKITVVSNVDYFQFVPSNPWVAVNWRKRDDIAFPIAPYLEKKGIDFVPVGVKRVHPQDNRLELNDGRSLSYDYLVIATGPKLAFEEVEGLGPDGHTQSVCHVDHAVKAGQAWESFVTDPGPIVVGAVQGASCYGPAYEFAMIMDTDLRKRKIRDKVPMTYVTAEPYIGHLGLGGVGDSKGLLESAMRDRHIKWITNAKVTKIEAGKMHVTEYDDMGKEKRTHELPFKYSMMLPAFKGIDAVFGIEGLTNPRGFVLVDQQTPVPTGAPKTGYMIESMVEATAENIRAQIDGKEPSATATWNAVCLADFGDTGAAFVALPQIPPRNVNYFVEGKWVHLAKVAFEKYFMRKMKKGTTEPLYEKLLLHSLGIKKLKDAA
jgi:sulfide:quinone oxidoreductase